MLFFSGVTNIYAKRCMYRHVFRDTISCLLCLRRLPLDGLRASFPSRVATLHPRQHIRDTSSLVTPHHDPLDASSSFPPPNRLATRVMTYRTTINTVRPSPDPLMYNRGFALNLAQIYGTHCPSPEKKLYMKIKENQPFN